MLTIQRKISKYNYSSRNGSPIQYIVLHYTGNSSDSALANANYFNSCDRGASAHYFVDNNSIYQVVEDNNASWAVGGGTVLTASNRNSISIEMCTSGNYVVSQQTEDNAIDLVKYLMNKYNIDINHIVRHYDCNTIHKVCPNWSDNSWARWYSFKDKILNKDYVKGTWKLSNNGKWWFENLDKTYPKDCWYKLPKGNNNLTLAWFLFDTEGYMKTMWQSDNCLWYQLTENGDMQSNTWYYDKKICKWYWLKNDGSMACNETLYINGKECSFNDKGEWI